MLFALIFPRAQRASTYDISAERNVWLQSALRSFAIVCDYMETGLFAIVCDPAFSVGHRTLSGKFKVSTGECQVWSEMLIQLFCQDVKYIFILEKQTRRWTFNTMAVNAMNIFGGNCESYDYVYNIKS